MSQLYILQIFQNNIQSSQTYNYYFWLLWARSSQVKSPLSISQNADTENIVFRPNADTLMIYSQIK